MAAPDAAKSVAQDAVMQISQRFNLDEIRQLAFVNAAFFEPRFEVIKDALIDLGFFSAASLILEFLKKHPAGVWTAGSGDLPLKSLGIRRRWDGQESWGGRACQV
jgi:hypothetical protein